MTRVLLVNDDGIEAAGLALLERCAHAVFDEVFVVAPASEQSGVGMGLTLHDPMRFTPRGEGRWAVTGTPVDCMITAFSHLLEDRRPDLVLSGVNRGANLGHDVYYSGTAAGAREGLMRGVPSAALSLAGQGTYPFDVYDGVVEHLLRWLAVRPPTPAHMLNINIPTPEVSTGAEHELFHGAPALRGVQFTRLGDRSYDNQLILREDPRGLSYFWIGGEFPEMGDAPGTDCRALRDGYVSITPVRLDATHHEAIDEVAQQWNHWTEER
ncbi:MAG: 5'/3'-nucleotidase SurE [Myxococcota bacterium]|nr:5'/3'-nucleotidase SurE [Myxococcota bacterium]